MESTDKVCSRCNKFKSLSEFYKQGHRHESLCKECKKNSREKRDTAVAPTSEQNDELNRKSKNGLVTKNHEREVVPVYDESIFYPEEARRALGISDDDMDWVIAYFRWQMEQREKRLKKEE